MFYRPQDGHGLPHNPFKAIVSPRPIGWISTRGSDGRDNLAPYSFFNAVADIPPQVMFASTGSKEDREVGKDTLSNIRETGVFCVNIAEYALRHEMNASAVPLPAGEDEFVVAGLEKSECREVACSRVAYAPASLECRLTQFVELLGENHTMVLGEVVGIHMRDDCLFDGQLDVTSYQPLARLGYQDYAVVREVFSMPRPGSK